MRLSSQCALLLLLLAAAVPAAPAQKQKTSGAYGVTRQATEIQHRPQLVTLNEGLAILTAALDSRHHAAFSSDCSHFVHGLYERAGFPYAYAPSKDLYSGVPEFRRVSNPQPGDLAVWRGHAGIVVNPVQHSFFSLMNSGPGVSSYDSSYWLRKGRARFYRYIKAVPGTSFSSALQAASLRPTTLDITDPEAESAEEAPRSEDLPAPSEPLTQRVAPPAVNAPPQPAIVNALHPKPEQVTTAFLQSCIDSEPSLRGRNLLNSTQTVIVFDHFSVKKVHIAGSQAWVDVQIDELLSLASGQGDLRPRTERQRWALTRHDKNSWELVPPPSAVYLPQHIAVRLLAQQLAQFTEDRPAPAARSAENAQLARLLDQLLQK